MQCNFGYLIVEISIGDNYYQSLVISTLSIK
jgi:hypothetical protein